MTKELLTPTEKAQSAFYARVKDLGLTPDDDIAQDAWANSFSVECFQEYADDLDRWTVALATLDMLADQGGRAWDPTR